MIGFEPIVGIEETDIFGAALESVQSPDTPSEIASVAMSGWQNDVLAIPSGHHRIWMAIRDHDVRGLTVLLEYALVRDR